jgi:hypothetical protein
MKRILNALWPLAVGALAVVLYKVYFAPHSSAPSSGSTAWIDPSSITPQPTAQSQLTQDQLDRIQRLQQRLLDADGSSLQQWEDDFSKDRDPERELVVWEAIADAYDKYCSEHSLTLAGKKEVLGILDRRSGADEDDVLAHISLAVLTPSEAREVMSLYTGPTEPVEVEKR